MTQYTFKVSVCVLVFLEATSCQQAARSLSSDQFNQRAFDLDNFEKLSQSVCSIPTKMICSTIFGHRTSINGIITLFGRLQEKEDETKS